MKNIVLSLTFFLFTIPSFASLQCGQVFKDHGPFASQLLKLKSQTQKSSHQSIQDAGRKGRWDEVLAHAQRTRNYELEYSARKALTEILQKEPVKTLPQYMKDGSTEVYLVEFASGVKAIFKPYASYWVVDSKKANAVFSNPRSEVAAYLLAKLYGMREIPITVMREIDGKRGSLQLFVSGEVAKKEFLEKMDEALFTRLANLRTFDFIIRQTDRNYWSDNTNFIMKDSLVWGIDNGSSFVRNSVRLKGLVGLENLWTYGMSLGFVANLKATTPRMIRETLESYVDKEVIEEVVLRHQQVLTKLEAVPASAH